MAAQINNDNMRSFFLASDGKCVKNVFVRNVPSTGNSVASCAFEAARNPYSPDRTETADDGKRHEQFSDLSREISGSATNSVAPIEQSNNSRLHDGTSPYGRVDQEDCKVASRVAKGILSSRRLISLQREFVCNECIFDELSTTNSAETSVLNDIPSVRYSTFNMLHKYSGTCRLCGKYCDINRDLTNDKVKFETVCPEPVNGAAVGFSLSEIAERTAASWVDSLFTETSEFYGSSADSALIHDVPHQRISDFTRPSKRPRTMYDVSKTDENAATIDANQIDTMGSASSTSCPTAIDLDAVKFMLAESQLDKQYRIPGIPTVFVKSDDEQVRTFWYGFPFGVVKLTKIKGKHSKIRNRLVSISLGTLPSDEVAEACSWVESVVTKATRVIAKEIRRTFSPRGVIHDTLSDIGDRKKSVDGNLRKLLNVSTDEEKYLVRLIAYLSFVETLWYSRQVLDERLQKNLIKSSVTMLSTVHGGLSSVVVGLMAREFATSFLVKTDSAVANSSPESMDERDEKLGTTLFEWLLKYVGLSDKDISRVKDQGGARALLRLLGQDSRDIKSVSTLMNSLVDSFYFAVSWFKEDVLCQHGIEPSVAKMIAKGDVEHLISLNAECVELVSQEVNKGSKRDIGRFLAGANRVLACLKPYISCLHTLELSKANSRAIASLRPLERRYEALVLKYMNLTKVYRQGVRDAPICLQLLGPPGVGKSRIVPAITAAIMTQVYPEMEFCSDDVYLKNLEEKFWSQYDGQSVVVCDDSFNRDDQPGSANLSTQLVYMLSNLPFPLEMPDLSDKGNTFFLAKCVILTSNRLLPNVKNTGQFLPAVQRRRIPILVKFKEQFLEKPNNHKGQSMESWCQTVEGEQVVLSDEAKGKELEVYEFAWIKQHETRDPLMDDPSLHWMDYKEFFPQLVERARKHRANEENTVEVYSGLDKFYSGEPTDNLLVHQLKSVLTERASSESSTELLYSTARAEASEEVDVSQDDTIDGGDVSDDDSAAADDEQEAAELFEEGPSFIKNLMAVGEGVTLFAAGYFGTWLLALLIMALFELTGLGHFRLKARVRSVFGLKHPMRAYIAPLADLPESKLSVAQTFLTESLVYGRGMYYSSFPTGKLDIDVDGQPIDKIADHIATKYHHQVLLKDADAQGIENWTTLWNYCLAPRPPGVYKDYTAPDDYNCDDIFALETEVINMTKDQFELFVTTPGQLGRVAESVHNVLSLDKAWMAMQDRVFSKIFDKLPAPVRALGALAASALTIKLVKMGLSSLSKPTDKPENADIVADGCSSTPHNQLTKKAKVWNVAKKSSTTGRITTARGETGIEVDNSHEVMSKYIGNCVIVKLYTKDNKMTFTRGLMLRDRSVLFCAHALARYKKDLSELAKGVVEYKHNGELSQGVLDFEKPFVVNFDQDYAIFETTVKRLFPNLQKHLVAGNWDKVVASAGSLMRLDGEDHVLRSVNFEPVGQAIGGPPIPAYDVRKATESGSYYYRRNIPMGFRVDSPGRLGDCGTILLSHQPHCEVNQHLLGYHVSTYGDRESYYLPFPTEAIFWGGTAVACTSVEQQMSIAATMVGFEKSLGERIDNVRPLARIIPSGRTHSKTKLVPTKICGGLYPITKSPTLLEPTDCGKFGNYDVFWAGVRKLNKRKPLTLDIDGPEMDLLIRFSVQETVGHKKFKPAILELVSWEDALYGNDMMKPMDLNTSAGYPFTGATKAELLGEHALTRSIPSDLLQYFEDAWQAVLDGNIDDFPFVATLKDEKREVAKTYWNLPEWKRANFPEPVDPPKTRIFMCGNWGLNMVIRRIFGQLIEFEVDNVDYVGVGINPHSAAWSRILAGFERVVKDMPSTGLGCVKYDVASFDTCVDKRVVQKRNAGFYQFSKSEEWVTMAKAWTKLEPEIRCIIGPYLCALNIWESGRAGTSVGGCDINRMPLILAVVRYFEKTTGRLPRLDELTMLVQCVVAKLYSDDAAVATSLDLTVDDLVSAYDEFGFKITSPDDKTQPPVQCSPEEMTFLSRRFKRDNDTNVVTCPLVRDSIESVFNYRSKTTPEESHMLDAFRVADLEFAQYGEKVYTEEMEKIVNCYRERGYSIPYLPNYRDAFSAILERKQGVNMNAIKLSEVVLNHEGYAPCTACSSGEVESETTQVQQKGESALVSTVKAAADTVNTVIQPVANLASLASSASAFFGLCKTPGEVGSTNYMRYPLYNMANGIGSDGAIGLGIDPKNLVSTEPSRFGAGESEMTFKSICSRMALVMKTTVPSNSVAGTVLLTVPIGPTYCYSEDVDAAANHMVYHTPMAKLAECFMGWRGKLHYFVELICPDGGVVTGRYAVAILPMSDTVIDETCTNYARTEVVDLTKTNSVTIPSPFYSKRLFQEVAPAGITVYLPRCHSGTLQVVLQNEFSGSNLPTNFDMNVWVCGEDMQFTAPRGKYINKYFPQPAPAQEAVAVGQASEETEGTNTGNDIVVFEEGHEPVVEEVQDLIPVPDQVHDMSGEVVRGELLSTFERPVLISTGTLTSASNGKITEVVVPDDYFTTSIQAHNRADFFTFLKFDDMDISCRINASMFAMGQLMMRWAPLSQMDPTTINENIYTMSAFPGVSLYPKDNATGTVTVPFISPQAHLNMAAPDKGDTIGSVQLWVLNQIQATNNGSTDVTYTIFAVLHGVKFSGPTPDTNAYTAKGVYAREKQRLELLRQYYTSTAKLRHLHPQDLARLVNDSVPEWTPVDRTTYIDMESETLNPPRIRDSSVAVGQASDSTAGYSKPEDPKGNDDPKSLTENSTVKVDTSFLGMDTVGGEYIDTIKPLIMRRQMLRVLEPIAPAGGITWGRVLATTFGGPVSPVYEGQAHMNMLTWLSMMYRCYFGSLVYAYGPIDITNTAGHSIAYVFMYTEWAQDSIGAELDWGDTVAHVQKTATDLAADLNEIAMNGCQVQASSDGACGSIRVPCYGTTFLRNVPTVYQTTAQIQKSHLDQPRVRFMFVQTNSQTSTTAWTSANFPPMPIYINAADDFSFGMLIGPPPVKMVKTDRDNIISDLATSFYET